MKSVCRAGEVEDKRERKKMKVKESGAEISEQFLGQTIPIIINANNNVITIIPVIKPISS